MRFEAFHMRNSSSLDKSNNLKKVLQIDMKEKIWRKPNVFFFQFWFWNSLNSSN